MEPPSTAVPPARRADRHPAADGPGTGPGPAGPGSHLAAIGRWSAQNRGLVALVWLVVLVGATFASHALGGVYSDNFSLPSNPAQVGASLLKAHRPSAGGQTGQIVFSVTSGTLAVHRSAIETSIADVSHIADVLAASDPLSASTVSADGRVAYSTVHFSKNPQGQHHSYVTKFDDATAPARDDGVSVSFGGQLGQAARPRTKDVTSELIGIAVAVVVLLFGFGSVYAAGIPLLSALLGAFSGLGLLGILAVAISFASASPTLGVMMGLGVGIDYALFLTTRHRQLLMDGLSPVEAAARTVTSSGRAVLTAATTVVIALLGLYASGISFIGNLGLAAGITVAVATAGALTLVPAVLATAGTGVDNLHLREPVAEAVSSRSGWQRYAGRVGAHPWRFVVGGVALLAVLAVPFFSMQLGHVDAGADPKSYTDKQAYDAVASGFGVGANGPFTVVAQLDGRPRPAPAAVQSLSDSLRQALASTSDVAEVTPVRETPDGALLYATVVPNSAPQSRASSELMTTLQHKTLPGVLGPAHAKGYVTGTLAAALQFASEAQSRLPFIVGTVIAAAFTLLLLTFRSPVLAIKAALLNLLSIGAAYGVIVAVFQWGWGSSALGVSEKVPIESYVPMIMFAIVFGLSMDYEVFLLARVRESWLRTGDDHESVAHGLATTGRVISCAALIMSSVFFAFLASNNPVIKMLALGLGVSVLVDATVVRLVVVPATMFLLGRFNWWTPRWLHRLLPRECAELGA